MRPKTLVALVAAAALAAFMTSPALAQPTPTISAQEHGAADSTPVCANCHEKEHDSIKLTGHGAQNDANGSSCQGCHGDAALHLEDPAAHKPTNALTSKDATASEKTAVCMTCHADSRHLMGWESGVHKKYDVTCIDCHSIHGGQARANFKNIKAGEFPAAPYVTTSRQLAYKACLACHRDQRAEFAKPSHHPVIEGKVTCQDCHDPHGSLTPYQLRSESTTDLCTTCHAQMRGPWIHEHPPVMENCGTCHTPHGSAHNRLLAQKPPALCGDCHPGGHTHGIYDGRGTLPGVNPSNIRFEGSGCVGCHRQIHGSNAPPSAYGQFFLR